MSRLALEGSPEAFKLWVIGLAVAREEQGLGDLNPRAAGRLAGVEPAAGEELLELGWWHRAGHGCDRCPQPPEGRVQIHLYLDWQDSPAEIAQRTEAGRTAARKRWASDPESEPDANRIQNKNENEKKISSRSSAQARPAKRATSKPPLWLTGDPLPEGCVRWLAEQGVTNEAWVRQQGEQLADWAISNGRSYKDWEAAWRNWLRRSLERLGGRPAADPAGEVKDPEEDALVREWLRLHPLATPPELADLEREDMAAWDEAMRPLRAAHLERARSEVRRSRLRAVQ